MEWKHVRYQAATLLAILVCLPYYDVSFHCKNNVTNTYLVLIKSSITLSLNTIICYLDYTGFMHATHTSMKSLTDAIPPLSLH